MSSLGGRVYLVPAAVSLVGLAAGLVLHEGVERRPGVARGGAAAAP